MDGRDYRFVTHQAFLTARDAGEFAEWAEVHGNYYGTLRSEVRRVLDAGQHVLMDIDVQGARAVRAAGLPAVFAFVAPPSLAELEARLRGRGTESDAEIATRMQNAKAEMER